MSGDPRLTVAALRQQLAELTSSLTPHVPAPSPSRWERERAEARGPIWDVEGAKAAHAALSVRAVDSEPGYVFVEGAAFSFAGDWHCLNVDAARCFAMALLAAADRADGTTS